MVVEFKEFMLHKTRKTKFNDKSGTKLAEDLVHHQKSFEQIFENTLVRDKILEILTTFKPKIDLKRMVVGFIAGKINENDRLKNILNNQIIKKIVDNPISKWNDDAKMYYLKKAFSPNYIKFTKAILEQDFVIFINVVWWLGIGKEKILEVFRDDIDEIDKDIEKENTGKKEKSIPNSIVDKFSNSKRVSIDKFLLEKELKRRTEKKIPINDIWEEYEDKRLTEMVKNHPSTIQRIKFVRDNFEEFIKNHIEKLKTGKESYLKTIGFDERAELDREIETENINIVKKNSNKDKTEIDKLKDNYDDKGYKTIKDKKNKNISYLNYFLEREGILPAYNGAESLAIIIGSLWAYEIKVKNLKIYTDSFDYEFDIMFYDHFGLDPSDVIPNGAQSTIKRIAIEGVAGFSSWYVLQHLKEFQGYTPLIVKMPFTYSKEELEKL